MDLQNLIDMEEIRQVGYNYGWAMDGEDNLDLYLSVFTEDGVWDLSALNLDVKRGHKELADSYRELKPMIAKGSMHANFNSAIQFQDRDHATARTYVYGEDHTPAGVVKVNAVYHDKMVRTDKGWKIKERILKPLTPFDMSAILTEL